MSNRPTELINFRDFGDKATKDGGKVRADRLYRCGHLAHVADDHLKFVLGLDFAIVADLRYAGERETEPSPWPLAYADRILSHGGERTTEAPHLVMLRTGSLTAEAVQDFYREFYTDIPFDPLYRPLFAATIKRVADADGRLLVHCAAGKDRTGIMCALLLDTLGVPRDVILADYLLSADAPGLVAMKPAIIRRSLRRYGHEVSEDAVDALIGVRPDYIETAFASIERQAGSVAEYLAANGVDEAVVARLRAKLLRA